MLKEYIKKYSQKVTKKQIENFALDNNIKLKDNETEIIYKVIKNDIDLLIDDSDTVLSKIKDKLENTTYLKIKELINLYKEKYKDYL